MQRTPNSLTDLAELGAAANPPVQTAIFVQNGEHWTIGYAGATFSLKATKGLKYLQRLLASPGKELLALDLANEADTNAAADFRHTRELLTNLNIRIRGFGEAGAMLEARAKRQYWQRILELKEELEDLAERGDVGRAEKVRSEIEQIETEAARAVGIGGRDRITGSDSERARRSVIRAIKAALQKISEHHAPLGLLLERAVKTGSFCRVDPKIPINWKFSLEAKEAKEAPVAAELTTPQLSEIDVPRRPADKTKFVGRDVEYGILRRCLGQVSSGEGRVVMISGEPGVGKSRLARQLSAEAAKQGFLVDAGGCYERENPVAFGPIIEMLEARARGSNQSGFQDAPGSDAAEIARLMPQLRRLFPDIPPPADLSAEESRQVLFTALSEFLVRAAPARPRLYLLEDLHWADEGTLSLLNHVARRLSRMPVLIVGTYRHIELDPGGPLARIQDELIRLRLLERINLSGLQRDAVAEMVAALSSRKPPHALVDLIYSTTEGNPFFIEELYQVMAERGELTEPNGDFRRRSFGPRARRDPRVRLQHLVSILGATVGNEGAEYLVRGKPVGKILEQFHEVWYESLALKDSDETLDWLREVAEARLDIGEGRLRVLAPWLYSPCREEHYECEGPCCCEKYRESGWDRDTKHGLAPARLAGMTGPELIFPGEGLIPPLPPRRGRPPMPKEEYDHIVEVVKRVRSFARAAREVGGVSESTVARIAKAEKLRPGPRGPVQISEKKRAEIKKALKRRRSFRGVAAEVGGVSNKTVAKIAAEEKIPPARGAAISEGVKRSYARRRVSQARSSVHRHMN